MDKKSYEPGDIESLLYPKCEFKVSSGFKDKVMRETEALPRRRRRFIPWIASAGVAAAVVAVVCLFLPWRYGNMDSLNRQLISSDKGMSYDTIGESGLDAVKTEREEIFIAKVADEKQDKDSQKAVAPQEGVKATKIAKSRKTKGLIAENREVYKAENREVCKVEERIITEDRDITESDKSNSEIYANVEVISLRHKTMQLTEDEKLQIRRSEQEAYVSKMRLEVEMAESLIREVYRSIEM